MTNTENSDQSTSTKNTTKSDERRNQGTRSLWQVKTKGLTNKETREILMATNINDKIQLFKCKIIEIE